MPNGLDANFSLEGEVVRKNLGSKFKDLNPYSCPTHKIQSGQGAPIIQLQLVPKMLSPLVNVWVPRAYVVSFKLETDENLLIAKSRDSLSKYKHKLVIANILQTRRHRVVFVTPEQSHEIVLTREEVHAGMEIEAPIVNNVVKKHDEHIKQSCLVR